MTSSISRRAFIGGSAALALAACTKTGSESAAATPARVTGRGFDGPNPYLEGNFGPVSEEVEALDLPVTGAIPPALAGTLLRIGPNPIAPNPRTYHWFLGDGMVHAFELRDGRAVSYRNRWVRTDSAAALLHEAPIPGQPEEANLILSAANTSLVDHAGSLLALYEVSSPTRITPALDTVGRFDFGGALRSPMTAHPKIDPVTGELLFFGLDMFGPPYLRFHVADPSGALVRTEEIAIPGPSMMHDFAVTENHVVFLDLPIVYDFALVGKQPFPAAWTPEYGARVGAMPRAGSGSDVRWFDVELAFVFHTLNAYDDGEDRVVLDVVRHEKMFDGDLYGVGDAPGTLDRWTIDLGAGRVREERLDDRAQELPRVDPRVVGRPHRYGYLSRSGRHRGPGVTVGGLVQHDLETGRSVEASLGKGAASSEPVFVPASAGAGENEGWVLAVVYDAADDRSDLVVLDATDFGGHPVARVRLPQRVPFGFHGIWVPDAA